MKFSATLPEQLNLVAEKCPNWVALQDKFRCVDYGELNDKIARLASFLHHRGVRHGDRIAIVMENSIEYAISFYAAWRVGGVVVAINPQARFYELENIINQCGAKALLFDRLSIDDVEQLKPLGLTLISLQNNNVDGVANWQRALATEITDFNYLVGKDDLAQIIYTSGTTGDPKGVCLSHANLMSNVNAIIAYLRLNHQDSVLNVLPFHYCYGNSVLHTHLCVGAKVVLMGSMAFPQEVVRLLRNTKVTGFSGVPATYKLLLTRSDWHSDPPPLRYVTIAGGAVDDSLKNDLLESVNDRTEIFIMYGQTEAAARITWLPPEKLKSKCNSVGIAIDDTKIEIRNQHNQTLACGEKGEVCISGPGVMLRYWNNSTATGQVLVDKWLKTGDCGYLDSEGYLYLEGRYSDMIKVGAHRINPKEIEEIVDKLDFVNESAVVGVADKVMGQRLKLYIVGEEDKANILALKKHCAAYLPAHKVPKEIEWLSNLPKTATGKVEKYKLLNKMDRKK